MTYFQSAAKPLGVLLISLIALAAFWEIIARSTIPSNYIERIVSFEAASGENIVKLPHSKLAIKDTVSFEGSFVFSPAFNVETGSTELSAYIPRFEGALDVFADQAPIFSGKSSVDMGSSGYALFQIPSRSDHRLPKITFSLKQNSKRFISLSSIFIGESSDFSTAVMFQEIVKRVRVSNAGMNLTVALICLIFMISKIEMRLASCAFFISIYLALASVNELNIITTLPQNFIYFVFLGSPFLGFNLWLFGECLIGSRSSKMFWMMQSIGLSISGLMVFLSTMVLYDFQPLPLSVVVLSVAIPGVFVAARCLVIGLRRRGANLIAYGSLLFLFDLSVWHDILARVSFFGDEQYLVSVSRLLFVFSCTFILTSYSSQGSQRLRNANAILEAALESRSKELKMQFTISEELVKRQVATFQERRIRGELEKDLHDGVLSYISLINIMSEGQQDENLIRINKLSRFASNEIRLMIETPNLREMSLILAIAGLRRQFIDRFSEIGAVVNYNIIDLAQCRDFEYRIVIDCIRILQELVHNAAVRARSKYIDIRGFSSCVTDRFGENIFGFQIEVENRDGKSLSLQPSMGSGLKNIFMRAERMGASFEIVPIDGGARAILVWPAAKL